MAKPIKLTDEQINKIVEDFKSNLIKNKFNSTIDYKYKIKETKQKAIIILSEIAYIKMKALVDDFDTEVQWEGFVTRIDEKTFFIRDIVVPPHEVTGATVTSDEEEYRIYIEDLDRVGLLNSKRFHGHSHVNMGVSPSSIDMEYRRNVVSNSSPLFDNYFQIFIILNKRGDVSGQIYDLENNILYETDDIEFKKETGEYKIALFLEDAHKLATKRVYKTYPKKTVGKEEESDKKENYYNDYDWCDKYYDEILGDYYYD